jgi:hypothetical protein
MKGNKLMEVLIFAFIATTKFHRPKEKLVPEPDQFQPFDVQTLKHVYGARVGSSSRSSDRRKSYAVQAMS